MGELKQHQLPMTIDEQIENLKSLGLIIENEEYTQAGIGNNRIFGVLLCMKQILKNDKHWNLYVD